MFSMHVNIKNLLIVSSSLVIPLYFSMFRIPVGGAILRPADFLSFFVILLGFFISRDVRVSIFNRNFIAVYFFLLFVFFHSIYYVSLFVAVKETIQLSLLVLFLVVNFTCIRIDRKLYLKWFMFGLWCSVIYAVLYHFSIGYIVRYKLAADARYAFGLLSVFSMMLYCYHRERKWLYSCLFSVIPLFMSLERKGILGFVVVLACYLSAFILRRLKVSSFHFLKFLFLLVFVVILASAGKLSEIFKSLSYSNLFVDELEAYYTSNIHRRSLIINGIDIFLNAPLLGIGADRVIELMSGYYFDESLGNGTHNFYLDFLIKFGVFGLLVGASSYLYFFFKNSARMSSENYIFLFYCFLVIFFMADGTQIFILFYAPLFLSPLFERGSE